MQIIVGIKFELAGLECIQMLNAVYEDVFRCWMLFTNMQIIVGIKFELAGVRMYSDVECCLRSSK